MEYTRLISAAMQRPWAITPEMRGVIEEILAFRAAGGRWSTDEIKARIGAAADDPRPVARRQGVVAVLPIWGVIANRTFEASSGMTSTEAIGRVLQRAVADDEVTAILLDISSPGGTVDGIPELAAEIQRAKAVKPVVAIANAMAASAAYWLGSQADELVVTPSGQVGSIGVYMLFIDTSEKNAKDGIKYEAISAGEHKLDGAFWEPMSDETRAHFKASVDAVYADFLKAVAKGRNTTVADVKKSYGGGRVFDAKDALARGMVDRIETFDQVLARLSRTPRRSGGGRAVTADLPTQQVEAILGDQSLGSITVAYEPESPASESPSAEEPLPIAPPAETEHSGGVQLMPDVTLSGRYDAGDGRPSPAADDALAAADADAIAVVLALTE